MATGFGVDATVDGSGNVLSGMSAVDVRQVMGALYSPGIIQGLEVTTSPSALTYTVAAGTIAIATASYPLRNDVVVAPVPQTTISTTAPLSGSRTDIVYVRQYFPGDGDSYVRVQVGEVVPANAQEIMRFTVSAGQSNTNQATRIGEIQYSIAYGATLPILHYYNDPWSGVLPNALTRRGHGTFYLPTDRRLRFSITATLYAQNAVRFDNNNYCEYYFLPNIDGGDMMIFTSPGLHQAWGTYSWEAFFNVEAGTHTVNYGMGRMTGPGNAVTHSGVDGNGFGRNSIVFRVQDEGVVA